MKRINPLFEEDDHPLDALRRVGLILGFFSDYHTNRSQEVHPSDRGMEGFIFLIMLLEDTIMQISDALQEGEKEKAGKAG